MHVYDSHMCLRKVMFVRSGKRFAIMQDMRIMPQSHFEDSYRLYMRNHCGERVNVQRYTHTPQVMAGGVYQRSNVTIIYLY